MSEHALALNVERHAQTHLSGGGDEVRFKFLDKTGLDVVPADPSLGDVPYANATPKITYLHGNTSATRKWLSQTGTGTISAAPVWGVPASTDISDFGTAVSAIVTPAVAAEAALRTAADNALGVRVTALEALRLFRNYKTTGQQLTSNNTTFQNITNMRMPGLANEAWRFSATLIYLSTGTAHFKFQFTVPAGATLFFSTGQMVDTASANIFIANTGAATPIVVKGFAANYAIELFGAVYFGATPGDLQLQAAQNVATVETTDFVVAGSNLVGTQVA